MTNKLIKVIYLRSDELEEGYRCELDIERETLVALEVYSDGTNRLVTLRNGMVDYILNGSESGGSKK